MCLSCLESAGFICPVCQVKVDPNDPTQVSRPSRRERNRLDQIPVRCSSCQSEVARGSMEHHSLHSCAQPCPQLCGQSFPRSEMKSHESTCPNVMIPCPGQALKCPVEVKRIEMDNHIASCPVVALEPSLQYLQTHLQAQQIQLSQLQDQVTQLSQMVTPSQMLQALETERKRQNLATLAVSWSALAHSVELVRCVNCGVSRTRADLEGQSCTYHGKPYRYCTVCQGWQKHKGCSHTTEEKCGDCRKYLWETRCKTSIHKLISIFEPAKS